MEYHLPITQARRDLTNMPEKLGEEASTVTVTRRGEPVLAILPWELYESLIETLEILGDEELITELRQGIREARQGNTLAWEDVKAEAGL